MKKVFSIFISLIVIISIFFMYYNKTYLVYNNKEELEYAITNFINRPNIVTNNINIVQEVSIDNKKYVYFIINNYLGNAKLTKGINEKYKIESAEYGKNIFIYSVEETNKAKYFIISGLNYHTKIDLAKVTLNGKQYVIKIPPKEYFIAYCPVDNDTKDKVPYNNIIELYDKDGVNITDDVYKNSKLNIK